MKNKVKCRVTVSKKVTGIILSVFMAVTFFPNEKIIINAANMYENSDFIEIEQPELNDETKRLISLYQKEPSEENYNNLRNIVIENYNAVLAKKEAKLAELKAETDGKPGGEEKVAEMQEIVQEMYDTYWERIDNNMLRFTDSRLLKWDISKASEYDYIPVMGAGENVYIKRTTVTNKEYAEYIKATGASVPQNWINGMYAVGEDDLPVNYISYDEAQNYCKWLTNNDDNNTYRLPSESEWELAAGHMPKDADFNCGVTDGRTSVNQYDGITRGAHGAIDFWGNVWEWTSTVRINEDSNITYGVKGGSWKSDRTDCRTENKEEGRNGSVGYEDVGFRVIQVVNYKDKNDTVNNDNKNQESNNENSPEDNVFENIDKTDNDMSDNNIPDKTDEGSLNKENSNEQDNKYVNNVDYEYNNNKLTITWDIIDNAYAYYIYKYNPNTKRIFNVKILMGDNASYTYHRAYANANYFYIITTEKLNSKYYYDENNIIEVYTK